MSQDRYRRKKEFTGAGPLSQNLLTPICQKLKIECVKTQYKPSTNLFSIDVIAGADGCSSGTEPASETTSSDSAGATACIGTTNNT